MDRTEEHIRSVIEDVLGAISVVHIPVDDGDALETGCPGVGRRDGDSVQEAESHGLVAGGVMSGRTDKDESRIDLTCHDGFDRIDARSGGEPGGGEGIRQNQGIGIDLAASCMCQDFEAVEQIPVVDSQDVFIRGRGPGMRNCLVIQATSGEFCPNGQHPGRLFGMGCGVMTGEGGVSIQPGACMNWRHLDPGDESGLQAK